jgi:hypothetical protein
MLLNTNFNTSVIFFSLEMSDSHESAPKEIPKSGSEKIPKSEQKEIPENKPKRKCSQKQLAALAAGRAKNKHFKPKNNGSSDTGKNKE